MRSRSRPASFLLACGALVTAASALYAQDAVRRSPVASAPVANIRFGVAGTAPAGVKSPRFLPDATSNTNFTPVPMETKSEVVNGARSKLGLAPMPFGSISALGNGIVFTPLAPAPAGGTLGFFGASNTTLHNTQRTVDFPLPSGPNAWDKAHVWMDVDSLAAGHLYVLDCLLTASRGLVPTVDFNLGNELFASTEPDPKTKHSFFAFKATNAKTRLNVTGWRKASDAAQPSDVLSFAGCALAPAQ